mgnify:CR=1 FL=1
MLTICIILIVLLALDLLFTLALRCRKGHQKWEILKKYRYAHRGYHDKPVIPENSLPAFRRAIERGFGAELDVHLLKDGTLAVFHDSDLRRCANVEGEIEDLTLDELKQVAALTHLHIEGVFMHFCVADSRAEEDVSFTRLQYKRFMDMLSAMEGAGIKPEIRHCCNSGATILYPEFALDMVRPGIITYGNAPSEELEGAISLRPMMSLHSMIAQVRTVPAGTDISYGRLYRTARDTRVAVLPIGYADGLSRLLTGKASFYLRGKLVPVIGRICMDMCMLDVSEVPDAKPGDIVTIFGYDGDGTLVPCERLAAAQGTINYELLCPISKRIPRICHRGAETSQILQYIV